MNSALQLQPVEMNVIQSLDLGALNNLQADKSHEEWLLQRKGKFTASEIHRLMTALSKPNELPVGAITYVIEKVAETLTDGLPESFSSEAMQWGKDNEVEAIEKFEEKTRLFVNNTGENQKFIKYGKHAGCTPDGLGYGFGAETKCPKSSTHVIYKGILNGQDLKKINSDYYWQIQFSMLCAKKSKWFFISYDKRFSKEKHRLHYAVIERNENDIELLKLRLQLAIDKKLELIKNFK
ncbi:YqaJ viral recombinase family protein [Empedobacter sp.]|uniref:lambda exonuclease family protein n=1 Tax=Empedobacter sp. TaxID=1927715 RepID=UPI002896545C|nr:YqaJ viral recombinase family protein [Empedobacter sp.]